MRKLLFFIALTFYISVSFAQNEDVARLVNEGVALHDEGRYDEAIKKYDEALSIDKDNYNANYEKSLSLMHARRFKECIEVCKNLISKHKGDPDLKLVYVNYGSALDDAGDSKKAIKIYDEGLDKFPGYYLLHFNKGLTYQKMEKYNDALESYTEALKNKPFHPSSNYYTGAILESDNKIPSLLAYMTFVISESESERTRRAFASIQKLMMMSNVKKEGNNTTIYLPASALDQKKSKKDNDFSSVEFMYLLMGGLDEAKGIDSIAPTLVAKFDFKLQLLINGLSNSQKEGKGFYWNHYVPFFVEMKEAKMVTTFSNLLYAAGGDEIAKDWVSQNQDKIAEFIAWANKYDWSHN